MTIELVPLCTVTITLAEPIVLPDTPKGTLVIAEVADAVIEGERLRAHNLGRAAADWMTLAPDGTGTLDVRGTFETHDGALVFTSYNGRIDLSGGPDRATVYSAPLFSTGDPRYAWLNKIQVVAKGTLDGQTLTYEMAEVR